MPVRRGAALSLAAAGNDNRCFNSSPVNKLRNVRVVGRSALLLLSPIVELSKFLSCVFVGASFQLCNSKFFVYLSLDLPVAPSAIRAKTVYNGTLIGYSFFGAYFQIEFQRNRLGHRKQEITDNKSSELSVTRRYLY